MPLSDLYFLQKTKKNLTSSSPNRLLFLFNALRILNFLWILWSMLLTEFTLNYNHIKSVLGPGGRIYFPSQLIPMIIGSVSFVRLMYKLLEQRRDPLDGDDPSLPLNLTFSNRKATGSTSDPQQSFPSKKRFWKIFAPATTINVSVNGRVPSPALGRETTTPEPDDMDESLLEALRNRRKNPSFLRYVVTFLPWLSLLLFLNHHRGTHKYSETNTQTSPTPTKRKIDPEEEQEEKRDSVLSTTADSFISLHGGSTVVGGSSIPSSPFSHRFSSPPPPPSSPPSRRDGSEAEWHHHNNQHHHHHHPKTHETGDDGRRLEEV